MPLLFPDSTLSDDSIRELHRETYEQLRELIEMAEHPRTPIQDPVSLASVRSVLLGLTELIDRTGPPSTRSGRIASVNLLYDACLLSLPALKQALGVPPVPARRASSAAP